MGSPAWLCDRADDSGPVLRRAAGGGRLALPRPATPRQKALGDGEGGPDGREPACQVLSPHARRQETAHPRAVAMDGTGGRYQPCPDTGARGPPRGLVMAFPNWLDKLKRRRLDDDDFQAEIRAHLQMAADDRMADGADPQSARLASLKDFGNVTLTTEAARSVWTPSWLDAVH